MQIDAGFLPKGISEVLWLHPINLEFSDVLTKIQQKKAGGEKSSYERRLLFSCSGAVRTVKALPWVDDSALTGKGDRLLPIEQYTMLVSSLEFDRRQDS